MEYFSEIPSSSKMTVRLHAGFSVEPVTYPVKKMGGFSALYTACAAKLGISVREDICWDVDNVCFPNGVTSFDVLEFEQPTESKGWLELSFSLLVSILTSFYLEDCIALYHALAYNSHFQLLTVSPVGGRVKFEKEMAQAVAQIFAINESITSLTMFECGPALSLGMPTLSAAMESNPNLALSQITLMNNGLDDKDMTLLARGIGSMRHGISRLNVADNQITKKGIQALMAAFLKNDRISSSLAHLNLSGNKFGSEGSQMLSNWLGSSNELQELIIRDCAASVSHIAAGLSRGSLQLHWLDCSANKFLKGGNVSDLAALFSASSKLTRIHMASTAPSTEQLREMLRALSGNMSLASLELDLSHNNLGVVGANLLSLELRSCFSLSSLLVAGNAFSDKGLGILCDFLRDNDRILKLDFSDNFDMTAFRKSKATSSIFVDALGELLASEQCRVRELRIASTQKNTQMKAELNPVFVDMGNNRSVVFLDVSGQSMEYAGIVGLTKMIQLNTTLKRLALDDNMLDTMCVKTLLQAVRRNSSLMEIMTPVNDLVRADATMHQMWGLVQDVIRENQSGARDRSRDTVFLGRTSNVQSASILFEDESGELEKLRFMIRVHPNANKLTPEQKLLLQDVDNHHQAALLLAGFRSRMLDKTLSNVRQELLKFVASASQDGKLGVKDVQIDALESLKKSFPSIASGFAAVEESMDRFFSRGAQFDLSDALVKSCMQIITQHLEALTLEQIKSGSSAVLEELIFEMRKIVAQLDGKPAPKKPPKASKDAGVLSPRSAAKNLSPRSAKDVLRKFSADSALKEKLPETTTTSTATQSSSVKSHSRSKSSGGSHKRQQMIKSPRTKNLSLTNQELSAVQTTDKSQRRGSTVLPNPLVSERAMVAMVQEDALDEAQPRSARKKKRTARRRPRGPSTRFNLDDLAEALPPEEVDL